MKRQKTFDDSEPVLESKKIKEPYTGLSNLKPRARSALEVYDELEAAKLIEDDPLY